MDFCWDFKKRIGTIQEKLNRSDVFAGENISGIVGVPVFGSQASEEESERFKESAESLRSLYRQELWVSRSLALK
jgi:hypothetical protein